MKAPGILVSMATTEPKIAELFLRPLGELSTALGPLAWLYSAIVQTKFSAGRTVQ